MFYGQFEEDRYLSIFFDDNYRGVCIDVGAYDGISGSNTYYFEKKGWDVLCIEPIPESFNKCNSCRKRTINCCASNYDKDDVEFNIVKLEGDNVSAISSLEIDERLIETHRHLIHSIEKIPVKVKSLNTIFLEENIPKHIDFISIDTENTEIDVLRGLNFDNYNIDLLVIENNFNDIIIEDYLRRQNFKKINRIAVNDFYVNNDYLDFEIYNFFKIKHANYYIIEHETNGNVTDIINILARRYNTNKNCNINVDNNLFTDTSINLEKKLFLTLEHKNTNEIIKFTFDEGSKLDFDMIINELKKRELFENIKYNKNYIEVSIGEIVDKYSILELKNKYIKDQNKLNEIKKEKNILYERISENIKSYFYKLLLYINEKIWLDTDKIKNTDLNIIENKDLYIKLSRTIFENNQKRFRLKNYFNILENSNIKECKSYSDNNCFVIINEENDIYDKIPEINYLCISYDIIYFNINYKKIINKLFKNPNIRFIEDNKLDIINIYELTNYKIEDNIRDYFDFDPIKYTSAGKLGDFLNQLSVVCEKFYETGRKGELFITSQPETFTFGLQFTYDDTYDIIKSQHYIKDYKIYNNERVDIDLSVWRNSIDYSKNWFYIYSNTYNINWGNHMWIKPIISINSYWENKIVINCTSYRFFSEKALNKLIVMITPNINNCIFISNETEHYEFFCSKINAKINTKIGHYKPSNLSETITIINSAKECYLGISSITVIANALHKKHYIFGASHNCPFNNLKNDIKHVVDIF